MDGSNTNKTIQQGFFIHLLINGRYNFEYLLIFLTPTSLFLTLLHWFTFRNVHKIT